eukprot:Protomagalhaensia_sp_Gyna_25__1023@NODE_1495_length_1786_cov_878_041214_g1210_i0_p1_GENE_NODE_1495_length_1786_cov_878_041214_g1210_i0NODE_1495_length_1786_cov_878_041214_g1210_i0_p1_ORF_typecomplete_len281_score82_38P5CR_dimer/PF14748_6/7_9e03P5CR_dimer/PF14748_6/1_6e34F420_oxidored/PF03807_17/2_5e17F420_oxidored/PF03807_17/6e03Rossmannlike/PF10727_9/1_7e05NAD_binding_2/PF03446_15/0_00027NAD_binding_2/PF03446_15/5_6e02PDH/PF02153_17/0_0076Semialdhyde_dh/PF01118_24/0_23Semialdhyde_dh/PF01118_24/
MSVSQITQKVAFIGFGMMGQALMGGCLKNGVMKKGNVIAADPYTNFEKVPFVKEFEVKTTRNNNEAINEASVIFLAVKPFLLESMVKKLHEDGGTLRDKLVVSMVSSFNLKRLRDVLQDTHRIVRIMPNTPSLAREGATAICAADDVSREDIELVKQLMSGCGKAWEIPENRMNVWTALAGCGPAYMFEILEALADAAVVGGIPRDVANEAAAQLMLGAAKMAIDSDKHFGELKDNVCSPNGATIAGVAKMRELGIQGKIMQTVEAARRRYDEVEKDPNA